MPSNPANPTPCFVVLASGSIELASPTGEAWLTDARRDQIARLIGALDPEAATEVRVAIDLHPARITRLAGARMAYLVTLVSEAAGRADGPMLQLTPRQREVAEYAIAGATGREIAKALCLTHDTVRDHLKEIYRRLGVASRVELAAVLGASRCLCRWGHFEGHPPQRGDG